MIFLISLFTPDNRGDWENRERFYQFPSMAGSEKLPAKGGLVGAGQQHWVGDWLLRSSGISNPSRFESNFHLD